MLNYGGFCFVYDVWENAAKSSLNYLQSILLKDLAELKKHLSFSEEAFIVIDDVDHIDQLDALFSPVKD